MTVARSRLVDTAVTRWYHCISRCSRRAHLFGEVGPDAVDRKAWIENRLKQLDDIFAVSVGGFSVLDNHLHLLLRIDVDQPSTWSDEEVVRRWFRLYPPRGADRKPLADNQIDDLVQKRIKDEKWVAKSRQRLGSLGWFMKCLKEPLSRMVNKSEKCTGSFFEGRYKSIAILDTEALLTVCAYIDLNPVAAGIAATPEQSDYTSVKSRVENVATQQRTDDLREVMNGSVAASRAASGLEDSLWLVPIEDRRRLDAGREGMLEGFTLANYLLLVEHTGRMFREGKAQISSELASLFERLGSSADCWQARMNKLCGGRLLGRFFASSRERLRSAAETLGVHHLANLCGCPAS